MKSAAAIVARAGLALTLAVVPVTSVLAQAYPTRPITIVLPSAAGGGQDVLARGFADALATVVGQSVVVQNKPSIVGQQSVQTAPADGHTLLFDASTMTTLPFLVKNAPFDPEKDFTPITQYAKTPYVLTMHPKLGIRNLKDMIAYAKANPKKLAWGVAGVGTPDRMAAAKFSQMAGVEPLIVPYRGGAPALSGLLAGDVQLVSLPAASVKGHIAAGRLIGLGTTSNVVTADMPTTQPVATVVPGYDYYSWYGLWGPKGLSPALTAQIRAAAVKVATNQEFAAKVSLTGYQLIMSETAEFAAYIKEDLARNAALIKTLNIGQ